MGVFVGGPQLAWIVFVFIKGFSLVSLRSMISSRYFSISIFLFSHDATNLIWLTFVVKERGCSGFLGQKVGHRNSLKSSQIDRDNIDHHYQSIYKVFQVTSTG